MFNMYIISYRATMLLRDVEDRVNVSLRLRKLNASKGFQNS